jgi:N-formylglutamate amidohydrolase
MFFFCIHQQFCLQQQESIQTNPHTGYSVEINAPYQGTIVPAKHYKKDPNVHSIMIEVNRRLYMDSANTMNHSAVQSLNELFSTLFT